MNLGIIGSGNIGLTLGTHWLKAGHTVRFSARDLGRLRPAVAPLGPGASVGTPDDAATFGEAVLFAPPFGAWPQLARELGAFLVGKVVIDAANPYPQRDGDIAAQVIATGRGSGAFVAALLPGARVVKAFNAMYYMTLADEAHRPGELLAVPLAGNDPAAVACVEGLVKDAGFDPVMVGPIARANEFDPGMPAYNHPMTATALRKLLKLSTC